ncbi:MAG: hypothetical protein E7654_01535 [Ruminococcaceae bacterium]|nr:hypothetical protein [Oscillospiraceae bacterium]
MLMSMLLIPSFALSDEETNLVAGITSTWRWGTVNNSAGQKAKAKNMFDGVKSHSYCDGNQVICAQPQGYPTATYDINGLKASSPNLDEIKYTAIIGWPLPQGKAIVNTIRVYLNDIHEDGSSCKWMPDAFDIAVSPTGAAGSWQVVYSEDNIRCEEKFKVYEEGGKKTAYIEATFPATEVSHFAIALRVARCPHMEDSAAVTNKVGKATMRITEIEVMGYKAFNPNGYTNLMSGASMDNYAFDTANGFQNATDNVKTCDPADLSTYLTLATQTYTKDGIYNIDGQAGTDYVGYVTYKLRAFEEIEALRVYLDQVNGTEACDRMLDGMDIAISRTGKPGSWKIVYSEDNISADKKYLVHTDADGNKTAYVETLLEEPEKALYVRVAISDTGCEERTQDENDLRFCRITEIEAWTGASVALDGEESKETGINSLMLFPLLMRHRQYETETTTTMFGLRVKHLLRSADSITFEKNGIKVDIPAATLKALNLAGSDKLVVTIEGTDAENAKVTVTVNGEAVDIEGIASSTPEEPEVKGTTYRWDFDDLNEANGLNNLTDSAKSTKNYTFEDGCIVLSDRTTDFEMAETISLSPWTDWSIEWRAQLSANSALFGTAASEQNFVYLAYGVSGWGLPFRMVDANNKVLTIKYGDYATLNTEMNTWKAEYSADENRLTLKFFNEETQEWEVVGAGSPPAFNFELTHMFGRHGSTDVCLNGQVDYIEVFIGE